MSQSSTSNSILIIEDDRTVSRKLEKLFNSLGYIVHSATTGDQGVDWVKRNHPGVVICDFDLPEYTGIDILRKIKIVDLNIQVIIITENSNVKIAVQALKRGAFDYVTRPLLQEEITNTVQEAFKFAKKKAHKRNKGKKKKHYIKGKSRQSEIVLKNIDLIAPTDMSVVIVGETGTGKEYAAKLIHSKSSRAKKPFVAVDCGALPDNLAGSELFGHVKGAFTGATSNHKGCFERADGGTLFLDEISNLGYDDQTKLLRALQERVIQKIGSEKSTPIDIRIIAASNEDLKQAVQNGDFREDIYHRINEFRIDLSPLRERKEDIKIYALEFLKRANKQLDKDIKGFTMEVFNAFYAYSWSGNIRELRNLVKRAVLLCQSETIDISCLPGELQGIASPEQEGEKDLKDADTTLKDIVDVAEKNAILNALHQTSDNKTEAAKILGVDRKTLYNKLKYHGIQ